MPVDPHLGDDWTSAHTDPTAELVALRRDVRRLEGRIEGLENELWRVLTGETPEQTSAFRERFEAWREIQYEKALAPRCEKKVSRGFFSWTCSKRAGHEGTC